MQKRLLLTALGVGLVAVAGVVPASAMVTEEVKANIPFNFVVENTKLPAGEYMISPLGIDEPSVLVLRSADDKVAIEFLTNATQPDKPLNSAELVFDRYGKKEFLHAVLVPGGAGAELPVSTSQHRAEKAAMRAAERHALAVEHHPFKAKTAAK